MTECQADPQLTLKNLQIGETALIAEVAQTADEKRRGLSGRECIGEGQAMLFPYEVAGTYCYWMKDMNFAIDMLWLDSNKQVVTVENSVLPSTYPAQSFCPTLPAQYVVEVQAGMAEKLGWRIGTQFEF